MIKLYIDEWKVDYGLGRMFKETVHVFFSEDYLIMFLGRVRKKKYASHYSWTPL
jgi:hypothetical protein